MPSSSKISTNVLFATTWLTTRDRTVAEIVFYLKDGSREFHSIGLLVRCANNWNIAGRIRPGAFQELSWCGCREQPAADQQLKTLETMRPSAGLFRSNCVGQERRIKRSPCFGKRR